MDESKAEICSKLSLSHHQHSDLRDTSRTAESQGDMNLKTKARARAWLISLSKRCMHSKNTKLVMAVIMGQFLSVLLCSTGVTTQLLVSKYSVAVPTTQAFINYILLGLVYGAMVAVRSDFLTILRKNWWKYIILGVVDVEANYLIILAYKYTNLTTIQLLDSFTIVSVMVLSFILLRARYKIINFMGVSLSIVGILSLVLADARGSRAGRGSNPLLGDLLCLGGTLLYAISNVAQEFLVKNHSVTEYLGFIGVSGSIISAIQLYVLEKNDLVRLEWNTGVGLLFLGFGVSLFIFYSIMPYVMKFTSAVVVNLSLLTADFYTLIIGLLLFHYKFSLFYLLAFILTIAGVFIYNLRLPSTARTITKKDKPDDTTQTKTRGEEVVSVLRRALFESHTYEMSSGKEATLPKDPHQPHCPATGHVEPYYSSPSKSNPDVSILTGKLPTNRLTMGASAVAESAIIKKKSKKSKPLSCELRDDISEGATSGLVNRHRSASGSTSEETSYGSLEVQIKPPLTKEERAHTITKEEGAHSDLEVQTKPPKTRNHNSLEVQVQVETPGEREVHDSLEVQVQTKPPKTREEGKQQRTRSDET